MNGLRTHVKNGRLRDAEVLTIVFRLTFDKEKFRLEDCAHSNYCSVTLRCIPQVTVEMAAGERTVSANSSWLTYDVLAAIVHDRLETLAGTTMHIPCLVGLPEEGCGKRLYH